VHVRDIALAHRLALEYLLNTGEILKPCPSIHSSSKNTRDERVQAARGEPFDFAQDKLRRNSAFRTIHSGEQSARINLGTAQGFSIQEIITGVEQVTGKKIITKHLPRRAGDPAYLIADNKLAYDLLGWKPLHSDINIIISSAYEFYIQENNSRPSIHSPAGNTRDERDGCHPELVSGSLSYNHEIYHEEKNN